MIPIAHHTLENAWILEADKTFVLLSHVTIHSSCRQFIMREKWGHSMDNGFIFKKINQNININERKILGGPFRVYQLISSANPVLYQ